MSHVVARIGKPHGIRGEVTVQAHTDDPAARFAVGTVLPTRADPGSGIPRQLTVRSARNHNGRWLLSFEEILDRNGAERLRGTRLVTGAGTEPGSAGGAGDDAAADEGWYPEELQGLPVSLPDGTPVGTVSGLQLGPGQDRLVLALPDGRSASVPFVSALVPVVDLPGRRIVIDPPPGLLELG